jgi:multiple sugar transport system permease protein
MGRGRTFGLLYLAPAVIFVAVFTAYPLIQMIWMSFHNWSLLEPPRWIGFDNYVRAYNDRQFWLSLGFTLKYTLYITPILMVLGFLIALLVADNTPLRRVTRGIVFVPVVIGLSASSLLWYWLFSYRQGLVNRLLMDIGLAEKPIVWFGESVERSLWAVIISIVWKVVGFGMLSSSPPSSRSRRRSTRPPWWTERATGSASGGSRCRSPPARSCSSRSSASSVHCLPSTSSS